MIIPSQGRRQEPIYVLPMALALVLAAFGGGALGLMWQSAGFGDEPETDAAEKRLVTDAPANN